MKKFVLLSLLCMFLSTGWAFAQTGKYVEVIYFHGKQRCPTCRAIENTPKKLCITILPSLSRAAKYVSKRLIFLHHKAKR